MDDDGNEVWAGQESDRGQRCSSILQAPDGGFLLTGGGTSSLVVTRVGPNGGGLWELANGASYNMYGSSFAKEGGFLARGYASGSGGCCQSSPSFGDFDFWLFRVNDTGVQLWDFSVGGTNRD